MNEFQKEVIERIKANSKNSELISAGKQFLLASILPKYSYNFTWLSRPIIQYPQDIVAVQELIWQVRPDLIIETGIAHGGSLILSASMLALLDLAEAIEAGATSINLRDTHRKVLGIDIEIRGHNREAIETHSMSGRIQMIEAPSTKSETIKQVYKVADQYSRVMLFLDSMHTREHVLEELKVYGPLVSPGSYCVVFDTIIDEIADEMFPDRPWGQGNNPKYAVADYLRYLEEEGCNAADGAPLNFSVDKLVDDRLIITVAPGGYLKRI